MGTSSPSSDSSSLWGASIPLPLVVSNWVLLSIGGSSLAVSPVTVPGVAVPVSSVVAVPLVVSSLLSVLPVVSSVATVVPVVLLSVVSVLPAVLLLVTSSVLLLQLFFTAFFAALNGEKSKSHRALSIIPFPPLK